MCGGICNGCGAIPCPHGNFQAFSKIKSSMRGADFLKEFLSMASQDVAERTETWISLCAKDFATMRANNITFLGDNLKLDSCLLDHTSFSAPLIGDFDNVSTLRIAHNLLEYLEDCAGVEEMALSILTAN